MKEEQAQLKMTLLLISDWDGFQAAMRGVLRYSVDRHEPAGRGAR